MAIGKVAESENLLDIAWPAMLRGGITNIADLVYPVGSIYISANSTNPSQLFGGTWQQITGRFLLAAGGGYTAGATGGEATHTLTEDEMPRHRHGSADGGNIVTWVGRNGGGNRTMGNGTDYSGPGAYVTYTGGGEAHNNMPPYLVVYVWQRTA